MTPRDLRLLCTALGFTAVVMQGGKISKKEGAQRAADFATLIEEFCRLTLPDAIDDGKPKIEDLARLGAGKFATAERMATAIVTLMKAKGDCQPVDLIAKGFTHDDIDQHWPMAKALAHVELNMMDS
ncbi:MAG: hypothetical protein SFW62_05525 [Alphaproteobacteria bacterium]|nr:hypothetical protein [Alphaproteobacteria bacterium]